MALQSMGMTKVAHQLLLLHQQLATGEFIIQHGKQTALQWRVFLFHGRIVYATGGLHPVRRWYRAFKHYCPESFQAGWLLKAYSEAELWEIDLLNQALMDSQITPAQYKATITSIVQEVLFMAIGQKFFTTQWHSGRHISQEVTFLAVEALIQEAKALREQWRLCGLGFLQELMSQFSPDLAPVLRNRLQFEAQVSPDTYNSMLRLMRGQHTIWDIALELQRPFPMVVKSLLPFIRHGVIELREIPDLPALCSKSVSTRTEAAALQGLVACIDDNPIIGQTLSQILQPLGYGVLSISNPLQDIPKLLKHKPSLIFLDPVLVDTDGYDLCSFLHKTTTFQQTPIVILTNHDGVVDRVRAKLAGASEFLSKPLEASKVIQVIQKYGKNSPSVPIPHWVVA